MDRGRKLSVHKTLRGFSGRSLNVLCTQQAITSSKLTIETLAQDVKYVQS